MLRDNTQQSLGVTSNFGVTLSMIPLTRLEKAQRSSSRLAADPSSIPVAKGAQHHLSRELSFINPEEPVGDELITAFLASCKQPLLAEVMAAICSASCLNKNKKTKSTYV